MIQLGAGQFRIISAVAAVADIVAVRVEKTGGVMEAVFRKRAMQHQADVPAGRQILSHGSLGKTDSCIRALLFQAEGFFEMADAGRVRPEGYFRERILKMIDGVIFELIFQVDLQPRPDLAGQFHLCTADHEAVVRSFRFRKRLWGVRLPARSGRVAKVRPLPEKKDQK